ncbi:MAG: extracellular solute-binding protein [Ruminococcaceae bacterium]|nr:extracellular solute-binding protein [Oscillospiraceae bacterium]
MKRYLIFLLLLTFVLLSCTQTAEPDDRTAIFSGTELTLDVQTVADPPDLSFSGDTLTVRALQPGDTAVTLTLGTDGSLTGSAPVPDVPPDVVPAGGMLLDRHAVDGGEIVYAASYDTEPVSCAALVRGGQTVLTFDPAGDLGYSLKYDNPRAGELFRLTDALAVSVGEETRYLLLSAEGLCCYADDGTLLWSERGNLTRDIAGVGEGVCVLRQKAEAQTLHFLNMDDGSRSEAVVIGGEAVSFSALGENDMLFSGGGHDLYTANGTGVYALDFSEDRSAAYCTQIIDFARSDIYPDAVRALVMTDAQTAFLVIDDPEEAGSEASLWRYHMLAPEALPQKTELVLAIFSAQNSYQLPVYHFNRTHADMRIVVRDYRVYEDEDERVMRFNTDIAAGDIPDMVLLWQNSNYGTAVSDYERSDLFADLVPLLSADPDFDYEGLLSYVKAPYTRYDGGQYLFPLQPGASGYFADPAVADAPLTMEGYLDLCEAHGAKPSQGMSLIAAAVDDFYDEETASCSFDGGRLEALLTRAEAMADHAGASPLIPLRMSHVTLWHFVTRLQEATGGALSDADGEFPLVPVGYPTEDGALCVDFVSSEFFAVTRTCAHSDAAVDFLQMLMEENKIVNTPLDALYWHRFDGGLGQTYDARDVMEELAFYEDKTLVYEDNAYYIYADDDPALAEAVGTHFKITDAAADAFISYLDSVTRRVNYGSPAATIFREEYRAMADRPIAERLKIIQSKVSLYLSEQFG